jgi:septal ring factor EnvC (AmiA/AmiB activator)
MNHPTANQGFARRSALVAAFGMITLGAAHPVVAEQPAPVARPDQGAERLDTLKQHDQKLETIRDEQEKARQSEAKLRREIESISADRRKLNAQLIATASRVRAVEASLAETEARLQPLTSPERSLRTSLDGRRAVIAEVLAALQRMGRRPPPAVLVRPDDALQAVRSAIMLGAVLPEMHAEAARLAGDLGDLVRLSQEIAAEHERMQRDRASLGEEQQRLALLTAERQRQLAETESALAQTRSKAIALAHEASTLQDLIAKLEQGLDSARRAARTAAHGKPEGPAGAGGQADSGRLMPAIAFASAHGALPLPVNGVTIREFGDADGRGGTEKGLLVATRSRAQVTAPCDGWVVYAGQFRSYGQLLILNAGGGYHVLLAGMDRISVDIGQFVLTGEPVAAMGNGSQVAAILATGSSQPVLYVEFRKGGTPIDPSPWWATSEGKKARG